MSSSICCFLTCIQISQEAGKVVWYSHLLKYFSQFVVIYTVKGFGVINKAEVFCFFWNSLAFSMILQMLAIWSLVPLPFLKPAWTCKFMVHVLLKPGLENFEHYFTSMWDECNCAAVWAFFGIAFLWMEWKLTFSSPVATAEFSKFAGILSAALSQHHLPGFEIVRHDWATELNWTELNWNSITSTRFVHSDAS